jgi:hypothetical protein
MKKFNITFTENKKYNPATRTVMVETSDSLNARQLVYNEFGNEKKITITGVNEIKE